MPTLQSRHFFSSKDSFLGIFSLYLTVEQRRQTEKPDERERKRGHAAQGRRSDSKPDCCTLAMCHIVTFSPTELNRLLKVWAFLWDSRMLSLQKYIVKKKKKNSVLFLDFHSDQVFDTSPLCLQLNLLLHSFHYIQGCNKITEDSFKLYQWRGKNCKQLCSHAQRVQSDKYIS